LGLGRKAERGGDARERLERFGVFEILDRGAQVCNVALEVVAEQRLEPVEGRLGRRVVVA
jgi:hypothetical protein